MSHEARETRARSVVKALGHRILMTLTGFLIVYLTTGSISISILFLIVNSAVGIVIYFLWERIWAKIRWGIVKSNK